jgi:hypothetical protein
VTRYSELVSEDLSKGTVDKPSLTDTAAPRPPPVVVVSLVDGRGVERPQQRTAGASLVEVGAQPVLLFNFKTLQPEGFAT